MKPKRNRRRSTAELILKHPVTVFIVGPAAAAGIGWLFLMAPDWMHVSYWISQP